MNKRQWTLVAGHEMWVKLANKSFIISTLTMVVLMAAGIAFGDSMLLMDTAATKRDEGLSAEELVQWLEENKLKLHHWFFSTDLTSYVRGGRISKTAAVFGGLLEICPLLNMDNLGRLIPRSKIRTKKRVIKEIVSRMEQHAQVTTG